MFVTKCDVINTSTMLSHYYSNLRFRPRYRRNLESAENARSDEFTSRLLAWRSRDRYPIILQVSDTDSAPDQCTNPIARINLLDRWRRLMYRPHLPENFRYECDECWFIFLLPLIASRQLLWSIALILNRYFRKKLQVYRLLSWKLINKIKYNLCILFCYFIILYIFVTIFTW